jgi:hypothetical protein
LIHDARNIEHKIRHPLGPFHPILQT